MILSIGSVVVVEVKGLNVINFYEELKLFYMVIDFNLDRLRIFSI